MEELKETHMRGFLSVEVNVKSSVDCDFGIQIAEDGRVWICVDDKAFIRFRLELPVNKKKGGEKDE